jgi:hypothetical protein
MIIRRVICFLVLVLSIAASPLARASDLIGDTRIPFSADRTVVAHGKTYVGRIYAVPGKQRHEQEINGFHPIIILRADRQAAFLIVPELKLYTEFAFPEMITQYGDTRQLGRPIGAERIAGLNAAKYRVERQGADGSILDGWVWATNDGIVLKLDGSYTEAGHQPSHASLELSNIKLGPQDPALFELPPGLSEMPPDALGALLNIKLAKPRN